MTVRDKASRADPASWRRERTLSSIGPVDPATLPPCVEAESLETWITETLGGVGEHETYNSLDNKILHLTKEYLYRNQALRGHIHPDMHCLDTVYLRWAKTLFERQMEMIRLNRFTLEIPVPAKEIEKEAQELFIGEEVEQ